MVMIVMIEVGLLRWSLMSIEEDGKSASPWWRKGKRTFFSVKVWLGCYELIGIDLQSVFKREVTV